MCKCPQRSHMRETCVGVHFKKYIFSRATQAGPFEEEPLAALACTQLRC